MSNHMFRSFTRDSLEVLATLQAHSCRGGSLIAITRTPSTKGFPGLIIRFSSASTASFPKMLFIPRERFHSKKVFFHTFLSSDVRVSSPSFPHLSGAGKKMLPSSCFLLIPLSRVTHQSPPKASMLQGRLLPNMLFRPMKRSAKTSLAPNEHTHTESLSTEIAKLQVTALQSAKVSLSEP